MRQATAQPGAAAMAGNANGRGLWAPVRLGRHQMGASPVILRAAPAGGPQLATIAPQKPVTVQQVAHEESQLAILASHLSLEGDFKPEQVWPGLKRDSLHATTTTSTPSGKQALSSLETQQVLHPLLAEVQMLEQLMAALQRAYSTSDKVLMLAQHPRVASFLADSRHSAVVRAIYQLDVEEQFVLLVLPAMGQEHVLSLPADAEDSGVESTDVLAARLSTLASSLQRVEVFYDSIGGLLGYQCRSLDLIIEGTAELRDVRKQQAANNRDTIARDQAKQQTVTTSNGVRYHVPRALDLAGEGGREVGARTAAAGLDALPFMAEIYPVGGAGDRLGLTDEATGECLPSAMLPYCGRTMMEGLMRDLVAREYLYYKLTGRQVTTPVAVMTSEAKGNHTRITNLMEKLGWFGRGRNAFRVFKQPLVPVISVSDGRWLLSDVMQPMSKPGGHGAIWKLMRDEGVFDWMQSMGRKAALVRQISNPMAGMDTTLLALAGSGAARPNAAFGFMSCDRTIGASEGCNVLQERKVVGADGRVQYEYGYTNIEYTEFERLGISDQAVDGTSRRSVFPANTNVLYVGLQPAAQVVEDAVATGNAEQLMPGLIFNLNKKVAYKDPLTGEQTQLHAGRMECTMQNIADFLTDRLEQPLSPKDASLRPLSTFLVYNMRRKVTSSAKKKREPGSTRISQTPDGSFYDLQRNAWHLLQQCCVQHVPELGSVEQYLEQGPGFIFLFNPALGPLWDVISQKVLGGSLHQGSEMVLEVAEARLHSVHVRGSFLVHADNVTGHMEESFAEGDQPERRHQYSSRCGRIHMTNVHIENEGIDWAAPSNLYWKHQVARRESVQVLLRGHSEFEAHNVTLKGSHTFEVPDGFRMVVSQDAAGNLNVNLSPMRWGMPTWQWVYTMSELGNVHLQFVSNGCSNPLPTTGLTSKSAGGAARAQALARRRTSVQPVHRHVPVQPAASSQVAHAVAAGPAPAAAMWPLLEQLSETDATLDFTI